MFMRVDFSFIPSMIFATSSAHPLAASPCSCSSYRVGRTIRKWIYPTSPWMVQISSCSHLGAPGVHRLLIPMSAFHQGNPNCDDVIMTLNVVLHKKYGTYHPLGGICFVCFVLDPASVHGPKPKHNKHLPPRG